MILKLVRIHVLHLTELLLHFVLRKAFLIKQLLKLLLLDQFGLVKFNLQSPPVDGMTIELVSRLRGLRNMFKTNQRVSVLHYYIFNLPK